MATTESARAVAARLRAWAEDSQTNHQIGSATITLAFDAAYAIEDLLSLLERRESKPVADVLVGPRYRAKDVRAGVHGVVLEVGMGMITLDQEGWRTAVPGETRFVPAPISGPIVRIAVDTLWVARCEGCGQAAKPYRRRREPAMLGWAHAHRCPTVDDR